MKTKILKAPFLRYRESVPTIMGDMLLVLPLLYIMSFFYYGGRPIKNMVISVIVCYLCDILCTKISKRDLLWQDISGIVTGMMLPLLMPASAPWWLFVATGVFAVIFVKQPFGGMGNNPFNPTAAAFCFAALAWPKQVFTYPAPLQKLPIFGTIGLDSINLADSPASLLRMHGTPNISPMELLVGNFAGPVGATSIIVILLCGVYLLYRRVISFQIPLGIIGTVAVLSILFPRIITGRWNSLTYELSSGIVLFGAFFMATEPVSSPKHPYAKLIYGMFIGISTMLFRHLGAFEIGFPFALLIANSITPFLDKIGTGIDNHTDLTLDFKRFSGQKQEKKREVTGNEKL